MSVLDQRFFLSSTDGVDSWALFIWLLIAHSLEQMSLESWGIWVCELPVLCQQMSSNTFGNCWKMGYHRIHGVHAAAKMASSCLFIDPVIRKRLCIIWLTPPFLFPTLFLSLPLFPRPQWHPLHQPPHNRRMFRVTPHRHLEPPRQRLSPYLFLLLLRRYKLQFVEVLRCQHYLKWIQSSYAS
jgi:hypothetical protein